MFLPQTDDKRSVTSYNIVRRRSLTRSSVPLMISPGDKAVVVARSDLAGTRKVDVRIVLCSGYNLATTKTASRR